MLAAGVAAASVLAVGSAAHGAFYRNSAVFGRVLSELPDAAGATPAVALTFDDGPNPDATPRILDALGEAGVSATFFVLGRHAERWPQLVARAVEEGHEVANHGYFHRKLHDRSPGYVRRDLSLGVAALDRAAGVRPKFFRAPHGFRSPWVTPIARSMGQRTVGWTLGVWDSARPGAEAIVKRTVDGARPRAILLLHDGDGYDPSGDRRQTAEALPRIVAELKARGFTFAPLPA